MCVSGLFTCGCGCTRDLVNTGVGGQLCGLSFHFSWLPGMELRLSGLQPSLAPILNFDRGKIFPEIEIFAFISKL